MKNLSWNLRIVLGAVVLVVLVAIGFFLYYTYIRLDRDGPIDVENPPDAELLNEENIDGFNRRYYVLSSSPELVEREARDIEDFYRDEEFTCVDYQGLVYEDRVRVEGAYIQSICSYDRSHTFGFEQTVRVIIQPERTELTFAGGGTTGEITGGGELTGNVIVVIERTWGSYDVLGG